MGTAMRHMLNRTGGNAALVASAAGLDTPGADICGRR
jgi:hypothetical protein